MWIMMPVIAKTWSVLCLCAIKVGDLVAGIVKVQGEIKKLIYHNYFDIFNKDKLRIASPLVVVGSVCLQVKVSELLLWHIHTTFLLLLELCFLCTSHTLGFCIGFTLSLPQVCSRNS